MYDENGDRLDLAGDWRGIVTDNKDPLGIGRIRARVPGLLEPTSFWLDPKLPGAGAGVGLWMIPPIGAPVVVSFNSGGRSTEKGFYIPAGWRAKSELPEEISNGSIDVVALFSDRYVLFLDNRSESLSASLKDRQRDDIIKLDGDGLSINIQATTDISISSQGSIDINAPVVTIQGRPVLPSVSEPI